MTYPQSGQYDPLFDEVDPAFWAAVGRRFWAKVELPDGLWGCWLWRGARRGGHRSWDVHGPYGSLKVRGRTRYAHHVALALAGRGRPPPGWDGAHACRRRRCVNPLHLSWQPKAQNARDATAARVPRGSRLLDGAGCADRRAVGSGGAAPGGWRGPAPG